LLHFFHWDLRSIVRTLHSQEWSGSNHPDWIGYKRSDRHADVGRIDKTNAMPIDVAANPKAIHTLHVGGKIHVQTVNIAAPKPPNRSIARPFDVAGL
jgi:hypothetical protein